MPKSKGRKKKGSKKTSRHIPAKINNKVKKLHYFECAWCGCNLIERHHIKPYSLGGEHTTDNLILLCPNHHRRAHKGQISLEELKKRKSTHLKQDRIPGAFRTLSDELIFKLGNNIFKDVKHLIALDFQPIITVFKNDELILINMSLYDVKGNLIFWMRENEYWSPSKFVITCTFNKLEIFDSEENLMVLKMESKSEFIEIEFNSYMQGELFTTNNTRLTASIVTMENTLTVGSHIGLWIADNNITPQQFLNANNEVLNQ